MNRQQRRHAGVNAPSITYNMNRQQVEAITTETISREMKEVRDETVDWVTTRLIAAFLVALHDESGFGKARLTRVALKAQSIMECIEAKTVSLEDLVQLCKDEFDIDVREV